MWPESPWRSQTATPPGFWEGLGPTRRRGASDRGRAYGRSMDLLLVAVVAALSGAVSGTLVARRSRRQHAGAVVLPTNVAPDAINDHVGGIPPAERSVPPEDR